MAVGVLEGHKRFTSVPEHMGYQGVSTQLRARLLTTSLEEVGVCTEMPPHNEFLALVI